MFYRRPESMEKALEKRLFDRAGSKFADTKLDNLIEHFETLTNRATEITDISSGFKDLDSVTGGFQNGNLIIIAGRPGMGKTSLAINIALNYAFIYGKKVAILELEISAKNLISKMTSVLSRVEIEKIVKESFDSKEEQDIVSEAMNKLKQAPIYIYETSLLTYTDIEAKIRKFKKEKGIDLLIIDYLQLMESENSSISNNQQFSRILQSLKILAEELNIPVIALSQIDKAVENRKNKRPTLADLSKFGRIEQYADIIMLLYRDEMYNKNTKEKGMVEINIVNKSKHLGIAKLELESKTASFVDISN